jgi:hypothetical protein
MAKTPEGLTPEKLAQLYSVEGWTEARIAEEYGTYQVKVGRLRRKWGVPTVSKSDRLGLPTELTPHLRSLLVGSMLGDGRLFETGSGTAALSEYHCVLQRPYLDWKAEQWGAYCLPTRPVSKGSHEGAVLTTHGCRAFRPYWEMFYPKGSGNKTFRGLPLEWVDPFALAVWFMDDGSKNGRYFRLHVGPDPQDYLKQQEILQTFGVTARVHRDGSSFTLFVHDQASVERFKDLVGPHLHPSLSYKLDTDPYVRHLAEMPPAASPGSACPEGSTPQELAQELAQVPPPLPSPTEEDVLRDWLSLKRASVSYAEGRFGSNQGARLCNYFFPHRFEARYEDKPSVLDAWSDPELLEKAIAFQTSVGDPLDPHRIFRALQLTIRAPTNFRPALAKAIVETYLVLDPCAGYGGRAAGTVAAGRHYVGVDPHPKARQAYRRMAKYVSPIRFHHGAFEDVDLGDLRADLVFTSPPYFSKERYSDDLDQSWVRYPSWGEWVEGFLASFVKKSWAHLKDGGRLVVNTKNIQIGGVAYPIVDELKAKALEQGFTLESSLGIPLGRVGKAATIEPLLVFCRGAPGATVPEPETSVGQPPARRLPISEVSLRELYLEDLLTDSDIAEKFGLSGVRVGQLRKHYGIPTLTTQDRAAQNKGLPSFSALSKEALEGLYSKMGDSRIAALYGVSKTAVRLKRRRLGIASSPRKSRRAGP